MEATTNPESDIRHSIISFVPFQRIARESEDLYLLVGPPSAGKSVTIDLLTNKVLTQQQMEGTEGSVVVEDDNYQCQYDHIYYQKIDKVLFLQGFSLTEDSQLLSGVNLLKSGFLREGLALVQNLSIVIVLDERDKRSLANIIELLLRYLGLSDQNTNQVKMLAQHVYLLLTKTEDQDACTVFKEELHDLKEATEKQTVRILIQKLEEEDRVKDFPNAQPTRHYGQHLRNAFKTIKVQQQLADIIIGADFAICPTKEQQTQMFNVLSLTIRTVIALLRWVGRGEGKEEYEKLIGELYRQSLPLTHVEPPRMHTTAGKSVEFDHFSLSKMEGEKNRENTLALLKGVAALLHTLRQNSTHQSGYQQLSAILKILGWVMPAVRGMGETTYKLVEAFQEGLKAIGRQEYSQVSGKKKMIKKDTSFTKFRSSVESLSSNQQVLEWCLKQIEARSKAVNFDMSEVVYCLKMVRDLLKEFDSETHLLADELLSLYVYNDCYYQFDLLLDLYIPEKVISEQTALRLLRHLDPLKRHSSQLKLTDYLIANTLSDEHYRLVNLIRSKVVFNASHNYLARSVSIDSPVKENQLYLGLSMKGLSQKIGDMRWWKIFCQSNTFKKYIEVGESQVK